MIFFFFFFSETKIKIKNKKLKPLPQKVYPVFLNRALSYYYNILKIISFHKIGNKMKNQVSMTKNRWYMGCYIIQKYMKEYRKGEVYIVDCY